MLQGPLRSNMVSQQKGSILRGQASIALGVPVVAIDGLIFSTACGLCIGRVAFGSTLIQAGDKLLYMFGHTL